ncbi:MAG: pSer/pThr/pTyr-binding forkhead associated (FHA) protein [Crocinitomicaceae bacterium]|jgi:pSer/pThr/pTyr-binding forkhead associated (FHA) protein
MPRIIITEPGKSAQPYRLKVDRAVTTIGRGSDNDIIIEAGSSSTHHCVMKRVSGGFTLEDLGSTNGIKTDDTLFRVIDLEDKMSVKIGDDVTLEFTLTEEELTELGSEDFESQQQAMLPKAKPKADKKEKEEVVEEEFLDEDEDEEDEDEEESYSPPAVVKSSMDTIIFIILAILAVALGFYVRHYQDVLSAPEKVVPAAPATPTSPTE